MAEKTTRRSRRDAESPARTGPVETDRESCWLRRVSRQSPFCRRLRGKEVRKPKDAAGVLGLASGRSRMICNGSGLGFCRLVLPAPIPACKRHLTALAASHRARSRRDGLLLPSSSNGASGQGSRRESGFLDAWSAILPLIQHGITILTPRVRIPGRVRCAPPC